MEGANLIYSNNPLFTDLKLAGLDDSCGMKRWLSSYEGGKGVTPVRTMLRDAVLDASVEDMKVASQMELLGIAEVQRVVDDLFAQVNGISAEFDTINNKEIFYRRLGWFAAFALFIEPQWRNHYDTVPLPDEIILDKDPLYVSVYPGRLLKSKATGEYIYRQFAPMPLGLTRTAWRDQWHFNPQLHIEMLAIERHLGIKISMGQMIGMKMGFVSAADHRLTHTYVLGWKMNGADEWAYSLARPDYGQGDWIRANVWNYTNGIVQWVKFCGSDEATKQFEHSPCVRLNHKMAEEWLSHRLYRERGIRMFAESSQQMPLSRAEHFPRRMNECRPPDGQAEECPFLSACWAKGLEGPQVLYLDNRLMDAARRRGVTITTPREESNVA